MKLLLTGGSGFLGSRVYEVAKTRGLELRSVVRKPMLCDSAVIVAEINSQTNWSGAFEGIDFLNFE